MNSALHISETKFRALSEASPLGIFATDINGSNTYTNERFQSIFRMTLEESLGSGWNRFIVEEERALITAEWLRCAAQNIDYDVTFHLQHDDGARTCVRARARATYDGEGAIDGFVGTVSDITQSENEHAALLRSERLLARTGELAGVGGWTVDLHSGEVHLSEQTRRMHGFPAGFRASQDDALSSYPPHARTQLLQALRQAISDGRDFDIELPFVQADGKRIWVRVAASVEFREGQAVKLWGALQDITAVRNLSQELADQHELLRVTLESIGEAVITTDAAHKVTWQNCAAARLTGWTLGDAIGKPFAEVFRVVHETTREPAANPLTTCMLPDDTLPGGQSQTTLIGRDGREYGIEHCASPIRNAQDELLGVVLVFYDVTEQRRLVGEINYRASHDALTGLVNRSEFENQLERARQTAPSHGEQALLFIDLDQFKLVNDACGHAAGDMLLQQVGQLLASSVRSGDTLARLGGDEFAILLNQCSAEQALQVAQQICARMDDYRFSHKDRRFRIGTSIGLVVVDQRWHDIESLMLAADRSCYAAKEGGRNQVHVWRDCDLAQRARNVHMQWATRIETALQENRFVLYGQRIEPVADTTPAGTALRAEVLLRMVDLDGKLVLPGIFLPAAQRFALALRIDEWTLRKTIETLGNVPVASIGMLSLNLSAQSAGNQAFHFQALQWLELAGAAVCQRLCIEMAEHAVLGNPIETALFIGELRKLGVRVALDDFGANAASFGYLKTLKIDELKIDGQFIQGLLGDALDTAAVRCFVDVANAVSATTVAKAVDSPALFERVQAMGIGHAQGFTLHKPEPLEQLCTPALQGRMKVTALENAA
ncbi:MAG: diguanylate cyclase domain-containing protein [Janthinobacterium lividum]